MTQPHPVQRSELIEPQLVFLPNAWYLRRSPDQPPLAVKDGLFGNVVDLFPAYRIVMALEDI
jgi:hypothetical protein